MARPWPACRQGKTGPRLAACRGPYSGPPSPPWPCPAQCKATVLTVPQGRCTRVRERKWKSLLEHLHVAAKTWGSSHARTLRWCARLVVCSARVDGDNACRLLPGLRAGPASESVRLQWSSRPGSATLRCMQPCCTGQRGPGTGAPCRPRHGSPQSGSGRCPSAAHERRSPSPARAAAPGSETCPLAALNVRTARLPLS